MKETARKIAFILIVLFFAGVTAFSGYKVYTILAEYRAGEKTSEALQQFVVLEPTGISELPEKVQEDHTAEAVLPELPTEPQVFYPTVDFAGLRETNADVIGWIYIEDTNINYPIVQGTDNKYYVDHMADGTKNGAGSIFMDYRNAPDFLDPNTVIYGHNMKNKTMFAHLTEYKNPEFFEAHDMGKIMTLTGNFQFQVIGGYVASLREDAWEVDFDTDEDFLHWLHNAMDRSETGGTYVPDGTERIVTLSTCDYRFEDARYVLVCRILE